MNRKNGTFGKKKKRKKKRKIKDHTYTFLGACQKSLWNREESSRILAHFQAKQSNTDISKAQLKT